MVGVDLWLNAPLLPHMLCGRAEMRLDFLPPPSSSVSKAAHRERDVCNKKWGPSVTLVSLQLRETSCAAERAHRSSLFSYTRHSNNNALGIVHKYSSAHSAWLKWELRDADDERHCSGCGNYISGPGIFECAARVSKQRVGSYCVGIWKVVTAVEKNWDRFKLREEAVNYEWKGLLKWKLKNTAQIDHQYMQ